MKASDTEVDELVERAIERGDLPGAVIYVEHRGKTLCRRAYGRRILTPVVVEARTDTIYDLASLTKPVACALSILILAGRRVLSLTDRVARYFPAFAVGGKKRVTVSQLLLHTSGLPADNPLGEYDSGPRAALERIITSRCAYEPGNRFLYSDLGYIVLGELVRSLDGRSLGTFANEEIFQPLGMSETGFRPASDVHDRCAATERDACLVGKVHDPRARALGGEAGHAGLFSNVDDIAAFCRMIIDGGMHRGRQVILKDVISMMTAVQALPGNAGFRSYGFDVSTSYAAPWLREFRDPPVGHTGFTGTMILIHPKLQCFLVVLSNSIHMPGGGRSSPLRHELTRWLGQIAQG